MVDYLFVLDAHRRHGVGSALVAAIVDRWPNVWLGEGASTEGDAFLRKWEGGRGQELVALRSVPHVPRDRKLRRPSAGGVPQ